MKRVKKLIAIMLIITSLLLVNGCKITVGEGSKEKDIINAITENKILTTNVNIISSNKLNVPTAMGSGVIYFKESYGTSNYYYVLTNNHVVHNLSFFEICDSFGEIYLSTLVACDSAYDLAVLKFKSDRSYYVSKFKESNIKVDEKIICLGSPKGIINSVTLGEVVKYTKVNVDGGELTLDNGGSQVEFDVIEHNAPINQGSSGGVVMDYDFNIVGINFAASRESETDKFLSAYAVPSLKVIEFLINKNLA
jgi:serine protease Do